MNKLFRTNVRIAKLPLSPPQEGIRPSNPDLKERDPRPGRYSIVGAFIKLPESLTTSSDESAV